MKVAQILAGIGAKILLERSRKRGFLSPQVHMGSFFLGLLAQSIGRFLKILRSLKDD